MNEHLQKIKSGQSLSEDEMTAAMRQIMEGAVSDEDLTTFLTTLADRGETTEELTGAARVMREKATGLQAPFGAVDCCGTGGDQSGTYNISTAVAIVAAACGVPMAKHGNRASSSKSGAADVLEALGVNLDAPPARLEEALQNFNFAFLMATRHHEAMKHVAAVRKSLGRRTLFNLLGPLANPASTRHQLIGVFDAKWMRPMAETLKNLGTKRAWIVHGTDGLDEITVTAPTNVVMLNEDRSITETQLTPADFGLESSPMSALLGGDAQTNAMALRAVLEGKKGAYRNIVLANTAAVLAVHGSETDLKAAAKKAAQAIDSGDALRLLKDYVAFTRHDEGA